MIIIAGIRTSINLIDNMSAVLDRITGKNDRMKNSIENTQNTMNRKTKFAENLSRDERKLELLGAQYAHQTKVVQRLNAEYQKSILNKGRDAAATQKLKGQLLSAQMTELNLAESVERAGEKIKEQNNAMRDNMRSSDGMISNLKKLVGTFLGFIAVKKGIKATVGEAAVLNQQAALMQAAFGNADIGRNYFNKLQLYAIRTGQDLGELTDITKNFMQLTKNTDKLMGLTNLANKLSLRTGSLSSAEGMIQEALSGRTGRLARTLHLTDKDMEPLKKAIKRGNVEGITKAFDEALGKAGITDEMVKAIQESPLNKIKAIFAEAKSNLARAGEGALEALKPALEILQSFLQSEDASRFFGAISYGLSVVAGLFTGLVQLIQENWEIIRAILITTGVLITTMVIGKLIAVGASLILLHAPLILIILLISLMANNYIKAGGKIEHVTESIGGVFGGLYVTVYNIFVQIYNAIATVAEFLSNAFEHPMYNVKKLFVGLADSVLGTLQRITDAMDFVFGSNMSATIQNWRNGLSSLVAETPEGYKVIDRMKEKNFDEYVQKGMAKGYSLPGKLAEGISSLEDAINNFANQEEAYNAAQRDTLGNIDDTSKKLKNSVDKSNEDLQWMRDIAEQEVVNRFTAATLAPQISVQFGDVRETADVDGIVAHLEEVLTEQINIAAEGVHL